MADEEALFVVVGVDEPAGDAILAVRANGAGDRVEHVHAVYAHLQLASVVTMSMSGSPNTTKRLPLPVFLSSSAICRRRYSPSLRPG